MSEVSQGVRLNRDDDWTAVHIEGAGWGWYRTPCGNVGENKGRGKSHCLSVAMVHKHALGCRLECYDER